MPPPFTHVCDLFIINQYCTPIMFYCGNVCSEQVRNYFLVCSSLMSIVRLMLYYKKYVQNKRGLLFSLLPYLFNTKDVCSKQAGTCVLGYQATFLIQKMCVQSERGCFLTYSATFQIQKMCVQNKWEAAF